MRFNTTTVLPAAQAAHATSSGTSHSQVVTNAADVTGGKGPGHTITQQAGAATDATLISFLAGATGTIVTAQAKLGTKCNNGETVTVDVRITPSGGASATCLTGLISFADTDAAATVKSGTIDVAADDIAAGSLVTVVINQTAGGGPDQAADLSVDVGWRHT